MTDRTVLLVEDDDVDARLFTRHVERRRMRIGVQRARNGREALDVLRDSVVGGRRGLALVVLDLNMPQMGGIEFLGQLRSDPVLRDCIVFVLTTSSHPRDVAAAFANHVAGYAVKTIDETAQFDRFLDMIEAYLDSMLLPTTVGPPAGEQASRRRDS